MEAKFSQKSTFYTRRIGSVAKKHQRRGGSGQHGRGRHGFGIKYNPDCPDLIMPKRL